MTTATQTPATLDDLMRFEGKAELIGGRIIRSMSSGFLPHRAARRMTRSLEDYAHVMGHGEAAGDNLGYAIRQPLPSGHESLSPDASLYLGPLPENPMKFTDGPLTFAVEARSEFDYGLKAEQALAAKRADYFEPVTLVVWDVDPIAEAILSYSAAPSDAPRVFHRGDVANAEPAVPGWRLSVDDLFA